MPTLHTVTYNARGTLTFSCVCENCGRPFSYDFKLLEIAQVGSYVSSNQAGIEARKAGLQKLEKAKDARLKQKAKNNKPCPHCGYWQSWMVESERRRRVWNMTGLIFSLVVVVVLGVGFFIGMATDISLEHTTGITALFVMGAPLIGGLVGYLIAQRRVKLNAKFGPVTQVNEPQIAWRTEEDELLAKAQLLQAQLDAQREASAAKNVKPAVKQRKPKAKPAAETPSAPKSAGSIAAVSVQMIVNRPVEDVWAFFTTPENWEKWWGGTLAEVDPGWQEGATLTWKVGGSSTISALIPQQEARIGGMWAENVWGFSAYPPDDSGKPSTLVEMGITPKGGAQFTDGGAAHRKDMTAALEKFKACLEGEPEEAQP